MDAVKSTVKLRPALEGQTCGVRLGHDQAGKPKKCNQPAYVRIGEAGALALCQRCFEEYRQYPSRILAASGRFDDLPLSSEELANLVSV